MAEPTTRYSMPALARTISFADVKPGAAALQTIRVALGAGWSVEQEIDYLGEISIIAMSDDNDAAHPTLILFEKQGLAHVGVVYDDRWDNVTAFASRSAAVAAVIESALKTPA